MPIVLPPREVCVIDPETVPQDETERIGSKGTGLGGWLETRCPPEGGMYAYYQGLLYPYKGHPWAQAVEANNYMKRAFLMLFTPIASSAMLLPLLGFVLTRRKKKIRIIENYIDALWRSHELVMARFTFKRQYYNNFSRELWRFTEVFLEHYGISPEKSGKMALMVANLFEWDDVYRLPSEDLCSDTSPELLKENPEREIDRLAELYLERNNPVLKQAGNKELYANRKNSEVGRRILAIARLLKLILRIPVFKQGFIKALESINFSHLQLDEIDHYHVLYRYDYDYMGKNLEDRIKERQSIEFSKLILTANN